MRFVLAEKAINMEIVQVTPEDKPEDLNDLNPYNDVLTLVDRDLVLYEPQIMMEYLDERFPHPPLMPVDPVSRAHNRLLRYRRLLKDHLTAIAPAFGQKKYFMSDEYTLVDCYLTPMLWRLSRYKVNLGAAGKNLLKYAERIFERESFDASLSEAERELREV